MDGWLKIGITPLIIILISDLNPCHDCFGYQSPLSEVPEQYPMYPENDDPNIGFSFSGGSGLDDGSGTGEQNSTSVNSELTCKKPIQGIECPGGLVCPSNCYEVNDFYTCSCMDGYKKIPTDGGAQCEDINECRKGNHKCDTNTQCKNTMGGYYCKCEPGFRKGNVTQFCPSNNRSQNICTVRCAVDKSHPTCVNQKAGEDLIQRADTISQTLTNTSNASTSDPLLISRFLESMETTVLDSFIEAPRNQQLNTSQFVITMKISADSCSSGVQSFSLMAENDSMDLPCQLIHEDKVGGAVFISYKDLVLRLTGTPLENSKNGDFWVNSNVVTGAIVNPIKTSSSFSVTFSLAYRKSPSNFQKLSCVFWDLESNVWSKRGCKTGRSNGTHTICSCNHLTSFAVLMAPKGLEDFLGLKIVSHIGLSVSLLCLGLTLLTFFLCRSLRSAHTSILSTLCGCLFLGQLLILIGLNQTSIKLLCNIIAGGLHFLFLCAFCWMSIESVLLFMTVRNLSAVNYMTSRRLNFPVMCLVGFGIPAVIVGLCAAVHPKEYVAENYCWLHPSLVWGFLGPACVFITVNTVLLVLTVWLLRKRLASLNSNVSTLKNTRSLTFKASAQALILGCTWGIGYFQFGPFSLVVSYLFTICNSLQGAYIFLVHCLLNHQVRVEYRKVFCKKRKLTDGTLESKSTNLSNMGPSLLQSSESKTSASYE